MISNELHRKIVGEGHQLSTIPESRRYSAHFEYEDLVTKLNLVKKDRNKVINSSPYRLDLKTAFVPRLISSTARHLKSKKKLNPIYSQRVIKKHSSKPYDSSMKPKSIYRRKSNEAKEIEIQVPHRNQASLVKITTDEEYKSKFLRKSKSRKIIR